MVRVSDMSKHVCRVSDMSCHVLNMWTRYMSEARHVFPTHVTCTLFKPVMSYSRHTKNNTRSKHSTTRASCSGHAETYHTFEIHHNKVLDINTTCLTTQYGLVNHIIKYLFV